MSLFGKTFRPRLPDEFRFLSDMTHEAQIEWLKANRDVFKQNSVLRNQLEAALEEDAILRDQLKALENSLNEVLRRNGELTSALNKVEAEAVSVSSVREEMKVETKNAMNEAKVSMFDNVLEIVRAVKR